MRVPLSWLRDSVALPPEPETLAERFNRAGLEVVAAERFGLPGAPLPWDRDKVLVARVLKIEQHPNADKLKLVTLDYGAAEPKTVVTGAPNIAPGQSGMKVVLGLRGSRYYSEDKSGQRVTLTLEPKALRGIDNDAMCMSNFELGLPDDGVDGIILLDGSDAEPGTPAADLLGDHVLDLDVLPNMARCLAVAGVAREVSALTGAELCRHAPNAPASRDSAEGKVAVQIADARLCPRYRATLLRNVRAGVAPRWMRSRLLLAGMRPISAAVDITNYVMLEHGQPLHAFDYDVLVRRAGGATPVIAVRPAAQGETLVTLDGQTRQLSPENLVIADAAGPVALAGVMGGRETEVTDATTNVLLESAAFDPVSVRKTARQFNLFSEASGRFSRGVSPAVVPEAAARAAELFHQHCGAEVLAGFVEAYPAPHVPPTVELNRSEIERVLGTSVPDAEVERVLGSLGFELADTIWGWKVTAPAERLDIQAGAADLIEELARVRGYDALPERPLAAELPPPVRDPLRELTEAASDRLAELGLQEVICYALSGEAAERKLFPALKADEAVPGGFVRLVNPVSPERGVMRRSLLPGVLAAVAEGRKHRAGQAVFEAGRVYLPATGQTLPDEPAALAVALSGARGAASWDGAADAGEYDFFDLKGIVDGLLAGLRIEGAEYAPAAESRHLHPARSATVSAGGRVLGSLGELHPRVAAGFDLAGKVFVAQLSLDELLAAVPARTGYRPPSPLPPVLRDVAVVVPEETPAERVRGELVAAGAGLLEDARLFDVYRGDSIPAGTKSLAYALTYRLPDRALADKEVDKAHGKIEGRLRHVLGAKIRGKD